MFRLHGEYAIVAAWQRIANTFVALNGKDKYKLWDYYTVGRVFRRLRVVVFVRR